MAFSDCAEARMGKEASFSPIHIPALQTDARAAVKNLIRLQELVWRDGCFFEAVDFNQPVEEQKIRDCQTIWRTIRIACLQLTMF